MSIKPRDQHLKCRSQHFNNLTHRPRHLSSYSNSFLKKDAFNWLRSNSIKTKQHGGKILKVHNLYKVEQDILEMYAQHQIPEQTGKVFPDEGWTI